VATKEKKDRKNSGHRGSRKTPMTELDLIIQRRGKTYLSFTGRSNHKGGSYAGVPGVFGSFDMKQAKLNLEAGLL
jgi:hypothetical protein